jgi:hypothetical protein
MVRVSGAALARELMGRVLGSVAGDSLELAVVSAERDVEPDDGLAGLNEVKIFWVDASFGGGGIEEELDLFKETRFTVNVEAWASDLWHRSGGGEGSCD